MLSHVLLAIVTLAQTGAAAEWKPFTSAKGKFTVSLPGKPSEKKRVLAVSGKTVDLVSMTARKGLATYTTAYAELAGADPTTALKVAQADLLTQSKGDLKDEKEISLGESPGKDLSIDIPKKVVAGGASESARIYVVGGRLYEVVAVVPAAKAESLADEVNTFFDSFKPTGVTPAAEVASKTEVAKPAAKAATTVKPGPAPPMPANPGGAVLNGLNALNPFAGRKPAAMANPTPNPAGAAKGFEFKAPDGSFSITAPDKLIARELPPQAGLPAAVKLNVKIYQVFQGSKIFSLLVLDLPEPPIGKGPPPPDLLTKMRDETVKGLGGKLVRSQLMPRDGAQGIEFVLTSPKIEPPRGGVAVFRAFLDVPGKRLYRLTVEGPTGTDDEKIVKEFLDSFHILAKAANK